MNATHLTLSVYFAERQRIGSQFLAESMLELFARRRVAASVMLRGISGFGHSGVIRTDQTLTSSEDPSVEITAVDTAEVIDALSDEVAEMTASGLITVQRTTLIGADPTTVVVPDGAGNLSLTLYVGRNRRINGDPAFHLICELLHRNHFAGASVLLGVDGTSRGQRRRAHFFGRNRDVPLMISAVGSAEDVRRVLPALAALEHRPLITAEPVQVCKRDGRLLAHPPDLPEYDDRGRAVWQKLVVHTSESTRHDGVPIHRALVRRLRESGHTGGATVLRGIWGFHGDHEPHGDRLFQYGRRVPVTTVIVDTPRGIGRSFATIDEVTGTHGLVTWATVPTALRMTGAKAL